MIETTLIVVAAFAFGGILKGATGFGAPLLAIPVMALYFDVPFAVAVFAIPNLLTNIWQSWNFRNNRLAWAFVARFALAGSVGAAIGTIMLVSISSQVLSLALGCIIVGYIVLRLSHPNWILQFSVAVKLAIPMGVCAGILQGSAGLSAPVSITFLNAMKLERPQFVSTISIFFAAVGIVQTPLLIANGVLNSSNILLGFAAVIPLMVCMPIGGRLAKFISRETFDKVIMVILVLLSINLFADALL